LLGQVINGVAIGTPICQNNGQVNSVLGEAKSFFNEHPGRWWVVPVIDGSRSRRRNADEPKHQSIRKMIAENLITAVLETTAAALRFGIPAEEWNQFGMEL
jgi:hypothetical protein